MSLVLLAVCMGGIGFLTAWFWRYCIVTSPVVYAEKDLNLPVRLMAIFVLILLHIIIFFMEWLVDLKRRIHRNANIWG
jgi:hypothetical protein